MALTSLCSALTRPSATLSHCVGEGRTETLAATFKYSHARQFQFGLLPRSGRGWPKAG